MSLGDTNGKYHFYCINVISMKYMLDTNIFNLLLDGRFSLSFLSEVNGVFATPIQMEELSKTSDAERRNELLRIFEDVSPHVFSPSFSWDVPGAGWDDGEWSEHNDASQLWVALESNKSKLNNWEDALIAEAAMSADCCLVTADRLLAEVASRHGISTQYFDCK
ncbi:type II toxin-antitoxin system VapC family toxin [Uliginosibacterium paludis]|uniref:PIN domain-containing protein n=1 Tax=Uliginosibacterium paludis TaxID=1615952 RepID=A0ABV2CN45_9RHOO